jgi:hypothetical protein
MSLIHLDKSVLTFHLKEIVEDGHVGSPLILLGLGLILFAPKVLAPKKAPRSVSLSEWVAEAQRQQATHTTPKVRIR